MLQEQAADLGRLAAIPPLALAGAGAGTGTTQALAAAAGARLLLGDPVTEARRQDLG